MEIPLTKNKVTIIDDEDYDLVKDYKWHAAKGHKQWYAYRSGRINGERAMHRLILGDICKGKEVDHINHNGLDNRRSNLRPCTHAENHYNQRKTRKTASGYKGVYWHKKAGKWAAQIMIDGRQRHLGLFVNEGNAVKARNQAAKKYHGAFAYQVLAEQEKKELPGFKDIIGLFVDDYEVGILPGEQEKKG